MTRTWVVLMGGAVLLAASVASAQEREPAPAGAMVRMRTEASQITLEAKMRVPLESKVVTGAPYSAEVITETTQVLADGNRIVHRTTGHVYRDGQGRVRREEETEAGKVRSVAITDPVTNVSYFVEPEAKVVTRAEGPAAGVVMFERSSSPDPADLERRRVIEEKVTAGEGDVGVAVQALPARRRTAPPAWEETVEKLPARQMEGVTAEGTRTTRTIPANAIGNERPIVIVSEEWRSPELQVLVMTSTSDPRTGDSTYRLANIVRQEPAPSYFEVPAGYTVTESGLRKVIQLKRDPK